MVAPSTSLLLDEPSATSVPLHPPTRAQVLADEAARTFTAAGFSVERNTPFAGAYVPVDYDKNTAVLAVMFEVRKDLLEADDSRVRVEGALAEVIRKAVEISRTDMGRPL